MNRVPLSFPEIGIIGSTRAAFGVGLGLLLAPRLSDEQRRAVGWTLVAVGAITTLPIVMELAGAKRESAKHEGGRMLGGRMAKKEHAA
jgi:hypothetical protein